MSRNVYFVVDADAVRLLHGIARRLIEAGEIDRVGAMTFDDEGYRFLANQDAIEYDPIDCAQAVHDRLLTDPPGSDRLGAFEERYGDPFLQRFLLADSDYVDYSHDCQQRLVEGWIDFYEGAFDEFEPDALVANILDGTYALVGFEVARERDATALWWKETRIDSRYAFIENSRYEDFPEIHSLFEAFRDGDEETESYPEAERAAREHLESFRERDVRPGYYARRAESFRTAMYRPLVPVGALRRLPEIVGEGLSRGGDYSNPTPRERLVAHLRHVYRQRRVRAAGLFEPPVEDEPYVFFPLHAQPEISTMIDGPMYLDQVGLIRQISRSIPMGHKLYVKEHPRMLRDNPRPVSEYAALAKLPNVRAIEPMADAHRLIRGADLVATVTGTPAFEAVRYRTPAMTFGRAHFDILSTVYGGGDPDRIADVIDEAIHDHEHDEAELIAYLTALFENSVAFPSDVPALDGYEQDRLAGRLAPLLPGRL